jgi:hypothetical protein
MIEGVSSDQEGRDAASIQALSQLGYTPIVSACKYCSINSVWGQFWDNQSNRIAKEYAVLSLPG